MRSLPHFYIQWSGRKCLMTMAFAKRNKIGVCCLLIILNAFVISTLYPLSIKCLVIALVNTLLPFRQLTRNMFGKPFRCPSYLLP